MRIALIAAAFLFGATATPSHATIISGAETGGSAQAAGGVFVKLTAPLANPFGPPDSVGNDTFQSPNLFGFDERQNVVLAAPLAVDVGASPIAAGTTVASHYVFFDPGPTLRAVGIVNFDADVLGIITSTGLLALSDFLGDAGINYLDPAQRGLEAGDSVTISGTRQIQVDLTASSPGDYVRVLTATSGISPVPGPAGLAILALPLVGLALRRAPRLGPA